MGSRFERIRGDRIVVRLPRSEQEFLADVGVLLGSVGRDDTDPASARLHVPVYLGDDEASDEWWRLMGEQLEMARSDDRRVFQGVVDADEEEVVLDFDQAEAFLRVVNEGRLSLAARLGVEVAEDFSELEPGEELALDFLSFIVNDLTGELSLGLGGDAPDS